MSTASPAPPAAFQPSDAQRRLLDYIHEHPGYRSVADLCAGAGVPRPTYYRWCQDPGFKAWLMQEWSALLLFEGWHLLNIARSDVAKNPAALQLLANLIFDPRGQAALQTWAKHCTPSGTHCVSPQLLALQQNGRENETLPAPLPNQVAALITSTLEAANAAADEASA